MSSSYEGDSKVKNHKLHCYRMQFEYFKMHEDEEIEKFFLWVDEIVNTIREFDETMSDLFVAQKLLRKRESSTLNYWNNFLEYWLPMKFGLQK